MKKTFVVSMKSCEASGKVVGGPKNFSPAAGLVSRPACSPIRFAHCHSAPYGATKSKPL